MGTRATQLPDAKNGEGGSFLTLFGSPPRESPCECERTSQVSLGQAMNLVNGPTIASAINDPKGRVAKLAATITDDNKLVQEVFLAAVCRLPVAAEEARATTYLKAAPSRAEGAQDLMWGLLTSPEFLFNH